MDQEPLLVVQSFEINSETLSTLHEEHINTSKTPAPELQQIQHLSTELPAESPPSSSPRSPLTDDADARPARVVMPFSSSPVLYPASSSPPQPITKKRRLFQTLDLQPPSKKLRAVTDVNSGNGNGNSQVPPLGDTRANAPSTDSRDDVVDIDDLIPEDAPSTELGLSSLPTLARLRPKSRHIGTGLEATDSNGQAFRIALRQSTNHQTYEQLVAERSAAKEGRARTSYYGVEIHELKKVADLQRQLDEAQKEYEMQQALEQPEELPVSRGSTSSDSRKKDTSHLMWTEKYRAKKFTELVGDERTHRSVLRWLKGWDEIVFPGNEKKRARRIFEDKDVNQYQHRKILLLTGPPGLGKTTLAHVCAKKAGYEALEINASDDRSRDVVRGRIKDILGTENVRGIKEQGKDRRAGKPVCVIVDEVDGVTTGSGASGEGGFMKALIDLVQLDQQNLNGENASHAFKAKKKKGDKFRMLRPLILVCNDVYAPSLRPLRTSSLAEIVHVRKPALDKVTARLKTVFDSECIIYDNDAVRRICESAWGMGTSKQSSIASQGAGEGDLRGILVQAEWIAHKFRATGRPDQLLQRLTRKWVEAQMGESQSASAHKGLGRGGTREVIERIFVEGAGLPNLPVTLSAEDQRLVAESKNTSMGVADIRKRAAISALRQMVDTCGEHDRLMTDCYTTYASQVFQDDTQLSKPNAAYDWLFFHDSLSRRLYGGQEWELGPYMNTAACAFHTLFASVDKGTKSWHDEKKDNEETTAAHPYSGPRADFTAFETQKANKTVLTELQASFSAPLLRLFSSLDNISTELIPSVNRMLSPDVKPVIVGGHGGSASVASVRKATEKTCIDTAVRVMHGLGLKFDKVKLESDTSSGPSSKAAFVYRMEP